MGQAQRNASSIALVNLPSSVASLIEVWLSLLFETTIYLDM